MYRQIIAAAVITAFLVAACERDKPSATPAAPVQSASAPDEPGRLPRPQPAAVYTVDAVTFQILERSPRKIVLKARGMVRTGGWIDGELKPLQTLVKEEGQMSFTFVAKPPAPDMFVTQMLTPIEAALTLEAVPDDVKRIRILAETNDLTQDLP